jgi:glycosyltransferase involved in cell wall biosynthesis
MNLLAVIHHPVFGGPHNEAIQLSAPLTKRGWRTLVVLTDEDGNAAERFRVANVGALQMPLHRLRASKDPATQMRFLRGFWGEVSALRRVIRERAIDLVTVIGIMNPHGIIAARLERVPVVCKVLDTRPPMLARRIMTPAITKVTDVILSTGAEVARVHPGAEALGDRLIHYYPPVDTSRFLPDQSARRAARAELSVSDEAILIGTVGNRNPQKGHEYLLRAAASIRDTLPGTNFRILGAHTPTHAAYEAELRAEARTLGLLADDALRFVDPGDRVAELLPAFDIFLLTSVPRSEGVPTAILEAMACGVPVVSTDVGGVREVVEESVTGFVVPPLDPRAIARAALRILDDPALRARMGRAARQRAVERFDIEVCAATHERAYARALAHHKRRHARSRSAKVR